MYVMLCIFTYTVSLIESCVSFTATLLLRMLFFNSVTEMCLLQYLSFIQMIIENDKIRYRVGLLVEKKLFSQTFLCK